MGYTTVVSVPANRADKEEGRIRKRAQMPNDVVYINKWVDCWTIAGVVVVLKMD